MPRKKNSGLGRGLDAIFLNNSIENTNENTENKITELSISMIDPKSDQPRKNFDKESLEELARSIEENGLLQPSLVREYGNGRYQIIAGERRFRASKIAGLSEIPAIILDRDDRKVAEISLIENIQREDLNPIEEARGYRTLMEEYGMTQEQASLSVGKSRSAVANSLRLLSLSEALSAMVENGSLSAGHARALLPLKNEKQQLEVAETIISRGLSVRQTETLVKKLCSPSEPKKEAESSDIVVDYVKEVERSLENALGRKIKLVDSPKRGRIEFEFYGADDREDLINKLMLIGKLKK